MSNFQRFFTPPKGSFFLFGPRGTGKSTWVKQNYPDSLYIDLLFTDMMRKYSAQPEDLVKVLEANDYKKTVIIDEIQKVPDLLSIIHALIEQKRGIQFILTGSSSRKLRKAGVNLLAGRAIKKAMHPFMAKELGKKFNIEKALKYGMLPLIWSSDDVDDVLDSYVNLYIIEEVQFERLVRNIGNFSRFLSTIAFSHGSLLNLNNIARECEVNRSTLENYISILQDLLLAYLILPFTKRAKRALALHPKFYFFDSGVYRVLRKFGPMDSFDEINGGALEGLVLQHLKAWCDYSLGKHEIYYWRTKSGVEVDFIIYGNDEFWAIEVKNNTKIHPKDTRGLLHFSSDYPECKLLLLYRGKEKFVENGVLCLPCEDFLKNLVPNKPFI